MMTYKPDKVPAHELDSRMKRFRDAMDLSAPMWEMAIIVGMINLYYFTGTMQNGLLFIPRDADAVFLVRKSYERALDESLFPRIKPIQTYKDALDYFGGRFPKTVYLETELVTLAMFQRMNKYFCFSEALPVEPQISAVRAVKSPYEIELMKASGKIHQKSLEEYAPTLFREGMSEADLAVELYAYMVREGHHGVTRFGMFEKETCFGTLGFGVSSIYPTNFDGPGGNLGISPAVPINGNPRNKLKKGQLVFLDVGCGVGGYHTDKTMTYMFGSPLPADVVKEQRWCEGLLEKAAAQLKPGRTPAQIYESIIGSLDSSMLKNFMGFGNNTVKFLGHGIGLHTDEKPVIAKGFDSPLEEGMVIALEPKKGIEGVGMVGIENTYLVTPEGGESITGSSTGLIPVF